MILALGMWKCVVLDLPTVLGSWVVGIRASVLRLRWWSKEMEGIMEDLNSIYCSVVILLNSYQDVINPDNL